MKNEKTIGLINFHFAHNYGALLESLALSAFLDQNGYKTEVIDYEPYYLRQYYLPYPSPFKAFSCRYKLYWNVGFFPRLLKSAKWFAVTILNFRQAKKRRKIERVFRPFAEKYLPMTGFYKDYKSLKKHPPKCDAFVCGSDQIWNFAVTSGLDPAYFLGFAPAKTTKIAYAVSPSQGFDTEAFGNEIGLLLSDFAAVSLRERLRKADVEKLYPKTVEICLDPTLLLNSRDYDKYAEPIEERDFILVYAFKERDDSRIKSIVKRVVEEKKIKVIDISLEPIEWGFEVEKKCGISPGQFLSYFKNASIIVTNSFHGTAFSIIYRKQFCSLVKEGTGERMKDLCNSLTLHGAIFDDVEAFSSCQRIDYNGAFLSALEELQNKSAAFLLNNLEGIEENGRF